MSTNNYSSEKYKIHIQKENLILDKFGKDITEPLYIEIYMSHR